MRRTPWVVVSLCLLVSVLTPADRSAAAPAPPPDAPTLTALFDTADLPGLGPVVAGYPITGDPATDGRIRALAEARGYRLRPVADRSLSSVDGQALQPEAAAAWLALKAAAAQAGFTLHLVSGHRSVATQRALFARKVSASSSDSVIDRALSTSAPPGYSKHHTGYALDIAQTGYARFGFGASPAFVWLSADGASVARRFGFVPSYPVGVASQGPDPEPWEWVYVGPTIAACGTTTVPLDGGAGCELLRCGDRPTAPLPPLDPTTTIDPTPSAVVPVGPVRVLDTRRPDAGGYLCPGEIRRIRITGDVVPQGATGVVVTVTVTESGGAGYVGVWPAGLAFPGTSVLNTNGPDDTSAATVFLPLGVDGAIDATVQSGGHVIVDVAAWYRPVATEPDGSPTARAEGRVEVTTPTRLLDTRAGHGGPGPKGRLGEGGEVVVDVAGPLEQRPDAVSAALVNITATGHDQPGFVTAWSGDGTRPVASVVNPLGPDDDVADLALVPVAPDGTIRLHTQHAGHLVVDLLGWVTGDGATESTRGHHVPEIPRRIADTRRDARPTPGSVVVVDARPAGENPSAVAVTVTATNPDRRGWVSAWPAGAPLPLASNLNLGIGQTRANGAVVALGAGSIAVGSLGAVDIVVDRSGWFTD